MDIEAPSPVIIKNPPAGGAVIGRAIFSMRKRGTATTTPPLVPLRQNGLVLDPRRIHGYAKLCGYTSRQGVPFTYPHLLAFPLHMALMLQRDFPFPVIGLVHLDNRITQYRRLDSGDRLDVTVRLAEWLAHEKGQAFSVETQITRAGDLVWRSLSTYLRLGVKQPRGVAYDGLAASVSGPAVLRRWNLKPDTGKKYAAISGDSNPIHTSKLGARLLGFPRPIAHGMWTKARALAELLPPHPIEYADVEVAFKTPAFLGGGLTLLTAPAANGTIFELRDSRAQKPHLRGIVKL